jgi:cysteine-rich CPXCG protein
MRVETVCPYCGESITVFVDQGGGPRQRYVEDCSVCCRPIELSIEEGEDGEFSILATRTDE